MAHFNDKDKYLQLNVKHKTKIASLDVKSHQRWRRYDIKHHAISEGNNSDGPFRVSNLLLALSKSHLIQGPDGCKSKSRLWARAEQLEDRNSRNQFSACRPLQVDNGVSGLINNHLRLVTEAEIMITHVQLNNKKWFRILEINPVGNFINNLRV